MELAREHGPIFRLDLPGADLVVVSSQELVDELCDERRFDKTRARAAAPACATFAGDGLFTAYNRRAELGQAAHRILMPAFGPAALRRCSTGMADIAEQLLAASGSGYGPAHVHRRRRQHDAADARHDRAVRASATASTASTRRDAPVRRRDGAGARGGRRRAPPAAARRPGCMLARGASTPSDMRLMHDVADQLDRRAAQRPAGRRTAGGEATCSTVMLDTRVDPETGESAVATRTCATRWSRS